MKTFMLVLVIFLSLCAGIALNKASSEDLPVNYEGKPQPGQPLTAVVVTQCNLIVVAYITTGEGKLIRLDSTSGLSVQQLVAAVSLAKTLTSVAVACDKVST